MVTLTSNIIVRWLQFRNVTFIDCVLVTLFFLFHLVVFSLISCIHREKGASLDIYRHTCEEVTSQPGSHRRSFPVS